MSTRSVDVAVRYAIDVTEKGLKQTVALSRDLGTTSTKTQGQVDVAMKSVGAAYGALEKIATSADAKVAKSAIDCATTVNAALDDQIAKLRSAGASYTAIIARQSEMKASSAELAAAIKRDSATQIAAMQATRAESDKAALQSVAPVAQSGGGLRAALRRVPGIPSAPIASGASREARSAERGGLRALLPGSLGFGGTALIGAVAGFASVKGIESSVSSTVDRQNVAQQLRLAGLTHAESQTLAASSSALGLSSTAAPQALRALSKQTVGALDLDNTGKPNQAAEHAFDTLGITTKQLSATGGDLYKTLGLVADALQRGKGGAAEYSAASTLLGKGFSSLNPLLKEGSAGLKEQAEWAEKYGLIAKGSGAQGLSKLHDEQLQLKFATMGLEQSVAQNLTPALLAVLPVLANIAHVAGDELKPAIHDVEVVLGPVVSFLKSGTGDAVALKAVIIGLATAFVTYKLAVGAVELATKSWAAVQAAMDALLTANPIGLVVVALAGLAAGIIYAYDHSKAFREIVGEVFSWLKGAVTDTISFVSKHWQLIGEVLLGPFGLAIAGVRAFGPTILGALESLPGDIGNLFSGLGGIVGGAFTGALNLVIGFINDAIDAVNAVTSAIPFGLGPPPLAHVAKYGATPAAPANTSASVAGHKKGLASFAGGGLVGALFSPGEQLVYGGMSATVPGARAPVDNVFAMVPPGTAVLTDHGQAMMGIGASLGQALAGQLPHFAAGGTVTDANGYTYTTPAPAGGKATPRYINHKLVGDFTEAGWQAYQLAHPATKATAQQWKTIGATVYDDAGATSSGKHLPRGFAELSPAGISSSAVNFDSADALGRLGYGTQLMIRKTPNSQAVTGAKDDIGRGQGNNFYKLDMGHQLAAALGVSDSTFKGSIQVAATTAGEPLTALGATSAGKVIKPPALSAKPFTPSDRDSILNAAFQAGLSGQALAQSSVLSQLIGNDAVVSPSGLISGSTSQTASLTAAGSGIGGSAAQMVARAQAISARKFNYEWGGGHNANFSPTHGSGHGSGPGIGYDCSGAVSSVLHAGGALKAPLVASQFMQWGAPGKGKNVSIFASPTHTFMELAGRYFGTSVSTPGGGAGWLKGMPEAMPATRHPPGLRRGGRIPSFATGGLVGRGALATPTRTVAALAALPDVTSGQVTTLMMQLATQLDDAGKLTVSNLESLVAALSKPSATKGLDSIQARRVQNAALAVDAEILNRVGQSITTAQTAVDQAFAVSIQPSGGPVQKVYGSQAFANLLSRQGIDPNSTQGLLSGEAFQKQTASALNAQIGVLNSALATAKKYGDPASVTTITADLNTALSNLDNATTQALVDAKQAVESAAQDVVNNAAQAVSLAQGGQDTLSLQQQIADGTNGPTGSDGVQMAAYINNTLIPALRGQQSADQGDENAASSVGDTARVQADQLKVQADGNAILQAILNAASATATSTQATANALKNVGGSLGLIYNQESFTDLAGVGTGI